MCAITPELFSHATAEDAGDVPRATAKASHQNLFSQPTTQEPKATGVARPETLPRNPFQLP